MKRIALASMVALACATTSGGRPTTAERQTVATAQYDPQQRDAVWSRALAEFQSRGVLVAVSDRDGGVLASQQQPTEVPCEDGSCRAVVAHQLTLTPGGLATLRTNRSITAHRITPAIEAQYQQETNDLLAVIAGSPASTFVPPAPPKPARPPPPEHRASAPCETYQDCPVGSLCSDGVCRP